MDRADDVLFLEIPSRKLTIKTDEGEVNFVLRELMADKLMKYLELRFYNYEKIRELAQAGKQEEAVAIAAKGGIDMLKLSLGDSVDETWIDNNLTSSMREAIFVEMDKLCRVVELLGNVQALAQDQPPTA